MEEGGKERIESSQPADKPGTKGFVAAWTAFTGLGWLITSSIGMVWLLLESFIEYFESETHSQVLPDSALPSEPGLYIALAGFLACAMQGLVLCGWVGRAGRRVLAGGPGGPSSNLSESLCCSANRPQRL